MEIFSFEQVAEMLRRKRQRLGVKQKKAADLAGLSPSQVNRMEKNSVNPSYNAVYELYRALETLETEKAETAAELMHEGVCWVFDEDSLETAAKKMRENDFSQLPVKKNVENAGRITERKILESRKPDQEVGEVAGSELMSVNEGTRLEVIEEILKQEPAVLVRNDGDFTGIITKSDLL